MEHKNLKPILMFIAFLFFFGTLIINIFQNQAMAFAAIAIPLATWILVFTPDWGDFLPLPRKALVITTSGLVGTLVGRPVQEYGAYETRMVAFNSRFVPAEVKEERVHGWHWFTDMIAGTVTVPLTGIVGVHWQQIMDDDCENPDGAIKFLGRLDGGDISDPKTVNELVQLERLASQNSYLVTEFKILKETLANITNIKSLDIESMSSLLQRVADKVKNVKIISPRGAGVTPESALAGDAVSQ